MQLRKLQLAIKDFIQDNSEMTLDVSHPHGLNIYKQNYFKNLSRALENKYPVTALILGNDMRKLFHGFILTQASTSLNLDDYGNDLADYLLEKKQTRAANLARIDLTVFKSLEVYEDPISAAELSHVTPDDFDRLTLALNTTLQAIKVDYEDLEVWNSLSTGRTYVKGLDLPYSRDRNLAIYQLEEQQILELVPATYLKSIELIRDEVNILEVTARVLEMDSSFNLGDFLGFCFKNNLVTGFKLD